MQKKRMADNTFFDGKVLLGKIKRRKPVAR
jgi:hypothetical protein